MVLQTLFMKKGPVQRVSEAWGKEGERRKNSRLHQFTVVAFSLRWNSSWLSSLLEEPFIYCKEKKPKSYV
jgi:hypothetical protein